MTRGKPWAKGQSGNPAGRPRGSRNRIATSFYDAMADDFSKHGAAAIERVRLEFPAAYVRLAASFALKAEGGEPIAPEDMSDEELAAIVYGSSKEQRDAAVRAALRADD
jgi:hypothetical protein